MRKTALPLVVALCATINSYAQFSAVYDNDLYSLTGYDVVEMDGKYFFTSGDDNNKVLFEIDPTDGSIVNPFYNIKQFTTTGSRNNIGKNSTAFYKFLRHRNAANWSPGLLLTGLQDYDMTNAAFPTYPGLNYYKVEDAGGFLTEYGAEEFIPSPVPAGTGSAPSVSYVTAYADQMTMDVTGDGVEDYVYLTGSVFGAGSIFPQWREPFVMRHHRNFSSVLPQSNYMRVLWGLVDHDYDPFWPISIPEYTTRIIRGENTFEAFITSGTGMHDGNGGYEYSLTKRDAGVWALGSNFWTQFSKTYSNGSWEDNLGVAQSIVVSDLDETLVNYPLTFVTSGDHPNTATNPQGIWDEDYFHLVKIRSTDGTVLQAQKYTMADPHPEYAVSYTHVNATDLVYVPNVTITPTSNKTSTGIYAVAGTAKKHYVGTSNSVSLERVFIVILNKSLGPIVSADFNATDINPADVVDLKVNRIKFMDDDYWIVGTYASQHDPTHRIPFLLRVNSNLEGPCNDYNTTTTEEATITVLDRGETLHDYAIQGSTENLPEAAALNLNYNRFCEEVLIDDGQGFNSPNPSQEALDVLEDSPISEGVSFLPNPANNHLTVTFPKGKMTAISIVDVTGKTVIEYKGDVSGSHKFDISALKEGVYLLKVTQGSEIHTMKLVKE